MLCNNHYYVPGAYHEPLVAPIDKIATYRKSEEIPATLEAIDADTHE